MGLAYFSLLLMIIGGTVAAVLLLKSAWAIWNGPQRRWLAAVPLILGMICSYMALLALYVIWKEPPWRFYF